MDATSCTMHAAQQVKLLCCGCGWSVAGAVCLLQALRQCDGDVAAAISHITEGPTKDEQQRFDLSSTDLEAIVEATTLRPAPVADRLRPFRCRSEFGISSSGTTSPLMAQPRLECMW